MANHIDDTARRLLTANRRHPLFAKLRCALVYTLFTKLLSAHNPRCAQKPIGLIGGRQPQSADGGAPADTPRRVILGPQTDYQRYQDPCRPWPALHLLQSSINIPNYLRP